MAQSGKLEAGRFVERERARARTARGLVLAKRR
jgi:hypothetical protein